MLTGVVLLAIAPPARPDGACCFDDGGCLFLDDWVCTQTWGGRYPGYPSDCDDTDNDGIADDCTVGPFVVEYPKLYWLHEEAYGSTGKLQRSNLDGSHVETLLTDLRSPRSIAVDMRTESMFWVKGGNLGNPAAIWRTGLDGVGAAPVIAEWGLERLALDQVDRKLYWEAYGVFKRANLDGSNIEIVLSGNDAVDLAIVHDPRKACTYVDADADGDVDLYDFAAFQECFSEAGP
jgi:hypothetical protein